MPTSDTFAPTVSQVLGQAVRVYHCQCGRPTFFRNSTCLACNTPLGYHPEQATLLPLKPGVEPGTWVDWQTDGPAYDRCANLHTAAACNWLLPVGERQVHEQLCRACRLNRTIPDLADPKHPDNGELWGRIELAKRRLVSALLVMGLPVASRETEDTESGLMFDFLRATDDASPVMTGHHKGLITLNITEADHAKREFTRQALNEPYRTLLGHFRHEVGHYYWDRLVAGTEWVNPCRTLFGDERRDYAASLKAHYKKGPRQDWQQHFVSSYASVHPFEDWAECWAHYMHMRDTVDTAMSFGLSVDADQLEFTPFTLDALYQADHPEAVLFLAFLNHWRQLTMLLNGMSRAMGQADFYPFVLANDVVAKLHFIHLVVSAAGQHNAAPTHLAQGNGPRRHQSQAKTPSTDHPY
ncbi:MAG: putative zinc-binding metallopeptidase [Rhodoferax sp.]|uniref:zinc-binding metallopeptidase family protein n=1 Tax=Rhodoferax sp. TaxID=50421 RepID=UPI00261A0796|nr:putative zinc-binding metallopeptidase [Rhodoferax sp.]MDD2882590.1 putative zinc-binding metallopeptidase [Rhodoferax sp.]